MASYMCGMLFRDQAQVWWYRVQITEFKLLLGFELLSQGFSNSLKNRWLKTVEIHCLSSRGSKSKLKILADSVLWLLLGGEFCLASLGFWCLPRSPWCSVAYGCITPIRWPRFPCVTLDNLPYLSICLCVHISPFYKDTLVVMNQNLPY